MSGFETADERLARLAAYDEYDRTRWGEVLALNSRMARRVARQRRVITRLLAERRAAKQKDATP